jgi:hypothetical protein
MLRGASLVLTLAMASTTALAAQTQMEKERHALETYCRSDVHRLCAGIVPGEGRIERCLKRHKEEMSVGCAKALQALKKNVKG